LAKIGYNYNCKVDSFTIQFFILQFMEAEEWWKTGSPGSIHHVDDIRWML